MSLWEKVWEISGPACPYIVTLKVMPGGILSMKILDKNTGEQLMPPGNLSKSLGFLPYQCDQLEDALKAAKEIRVEPGLTEPEPKPC